MQPDAPQQFTVSFAGSIVTIDYDSAEALAYLAFLFGDASIENESTEGLSHLILQRGDEPGSFHLSDRSTRLHYGPLDVLFSAHLFDSVIFHLVNHARNGIALHGGGLICKGKTVLLPGQSGAGKSTLTAWLTSAQCTYLTDELIFIPLDGQGKVHYLTRPICLKPGSVPLIEPLLQPQQREMIMKDQHGAIIPYRFLNPDSITAQQPPSLIILPDFNPDSEPELEKVSKAQLSTLLMGCHVNARNLAEHGFRNIVEIARSTPAYRLRYRSFDDIGDMIGDILPL